MQPELLDDVRKQFIGRGWTGAQHLCDVRDGTRIAAVIDAVVAEFGRIDILVNNAGVAPGAPVETLSEEVWDLNQDITLRARSSCAGR